MVRFDSGLTQLDLVCARFGIGLEMVWIQFGFGLVWFQLFRIEFGSGFDLVKRFGSVSVKI